MSTTEDAAMAEPGDKTSRFRLVSHTKAIKKAKATETDSATAENHAFHYKMRITMTDNFSGRKPTAQATYNPMPKAKTLMLTMAEQDPGLSITSINGKSTLIIKTDTFPCTETQFKQYFHCNWEKTGTTTREKVLLGCNINSNETLNNLKHELQPNNLLQWLGKEKVFLEADVLGIRKTKTIGYLNGIHPRVVN